jgi:hypothetical protein
MFVPAGPDVPMQMPGSPVTRAQPSAECVPPSKNRMAGQGAEGLSVCQERYSAIQKITRQTEGSAEAQAFIPYDGSVLSAPCCPDKFRGSLTAAEAAAAMAAGLP